MIDLLCPSKKLKLKANSKPWIDSETVSTIRSRNKLLKKYGLETDTDHIQSTKMSLQKAISKKKKSYFLEKIEKNANNSKELWKALKGNAQFISFVTPKNHLLMFASWKY